MTQSDKIVVHFGVGNIHKNYSFVAFVPNLIFAFSILHLASSSQRKQLTAPIIHIQFSVNKEKNNISDTWKQDLLQLCLHCTSIKQR